MVFVDMKSKSLIFSFLFLIVCFHPSLFAATEKEKATENEYTAAGIQRQIFERLVEKQTFEKNAEGWIGTQTFRSTVKNGILTILAEGKEPLLYRSLDLPRGLVRLKIKIRTSTPSQLVLQWLTAQSPRRGDDKKVTFSLEADGEWHNYEKTLSVVGAMTSLSMEFKAIEGLWEIKQIELWVESPHPLSVQSVREVNGTLHYSIVNLDVDTVKFQVSGQEYQLAQYETVDLVATPVYRGVLAKFSLTVEPEKYPPLSFASFRYHPERDAQWLAIPFEKHTLEITEDGSAGRIRAGKETIAVIAPLMHRNGVLPDWKLDQQETNRLRFRTETEKEWMEISSENDTVRIHFETDPDQDEFEGPVLRVLGKMLNGLFAGCEFLENGEKSSQNIDVEVPYCYRFEPSKLWVTMPLMAFRTSSGTVAMSWEDMTLQPTFLTPNLIDAARDHRMSLKSRKSHDALIWHGDGPITDAVLWSVKRHGVPEIPPAPRDVTTQNSLSLAAFEGPLLGKDGASWGHGAESDWPRKPYGDFASTIWRLSGNIPPMESFAYGGSLIPNDAIYFLKSNVYDWLITRQQRVEEILSEMRPDGSCEFLSHFPEIDPDIPKVGITARRAMELMLYILLTGDDKSFPQTEKSLQFLKTMTVPRGSHFWEAPLHTPDLLSAAYLVGVNVRAYEWTQDKSYLDEARRWALAGLPFVYFWSDRPKMLYSAVSMYGASNRVNPVWFGTVSAPSGAVFGHSLACLGRYDDTLPWQKIARGLLHAAESVQMESGPMIGTLPECFSLKSQESLSWHVNPSSIVSLRLLLDSPPDSLSVATNKYTRVVSPFPVQLTREGIVVTDAPYGLTFQIMVNGKQIIDVKSNGKRTVVPFR